VRGCAEAVPLLPASSRLTYRVRWHHGPATRKERSAASIGPDIWDPRLPSDCLKSNIAYWVTPAAPCGIHLIGYALPPEGQDTRNGCSDEDG
jgi:hypothetical protein